MPQVQTPEPKPREWIKVTIQISIEQYEQIKRVMEKLGYKTIAEFIRDAIREKLEAEAEEK
ncbi:MAG: ribbon-helix-helix domain-containing protein [Thermosphaera sp.]